MHFNIRLWGSVQLLEAVQEHYELLSPYVRSVLPLKQSGPWFRKRPDSLLGILPEYLFPLGGPTSVPDSSRSGCPHYPEPVRELLGLHWLATFEEEPLRFIRQPAGAAARWHGPPSSPGIPYRLLTQSCTNLHS